MLIPTKHEKLVNNVLVLGADVLQILGEKPISNAEDLFRRLRLDKKITLDEYYNLLTFLWLAGLITLENYSIKLKVQ